ncbi:MAG: hypothetical protein HYU69_10480 [Bacteroidetes bacterium]|nr:hypothetical protein [Bacteroidota bacterium]
MNNSKVIDLIESLSAIELRRFEKFLASPFFNTNPAIVKLFNYIESCRSKPVPVASDKLQAFKLIFGNEKYNEQKISDLMTYLTRHIEDFLSHINFERQTMLKKSYFLKELRERNKDNYFESNIREYRKKLQRSLIKDQEYYYGSFLLEKEQDHYFIMQGIRKDDKSLQHKSDSIDVFFLIEKLKNLCEMISRKNIISAEYEFRMKDEIMNYIRSDKNHFGNIPAIKIYYNILLTLTESENETHFKNLKKVLSENFNFFTREEAGQMYGYAQNYCIKKINSGRQEYHSELFDLYESLLKTKIIFEDKYLSQSDYKNIVSIGLRLEKFEWTKTFIEQYKNSIAPEFRENAYEYNLASYYYSKHDYKNALKLLQKVEFTDVFYHLGAKSMLLKMYYELEEVEPFYSGIDAFKVYLGRNKQISPDQRLSHKNLVTLTKKAFDIRIRGTSSKNYQKAIETLKHKINTKKNIANLQWLKERIEEL